MNFGCTLIITGREELLYITRWEMKRISKKELEQGNIQLRELVSFCKRYDNPFTIDFESKELKEALKEFKNKILSLPNLYFKMDTTFRYPTRGMHSNVDCKTFTSYYVMRIPEIYSLFKSKGYGTFFHEMREFLEDEILKFKKSSGNVKVKRLRKFTYVILVS